MNERIETKELIARLRSHADTARRLYVDRPAGVFGTDEAASRLEELEKDMERLRAVIMDIHETAGVTNLMNMRAMIQEKARSAMEETK